MSIRHGQSRTREYAIWNGLKARRNRRDYDGVAVDPSWLGPGGFQIFFAHVGPMPSPDHTLERKDNAKGYVPGNVCWATKKEQARNRRNNRLITIDGVTKCLFAWAEESPVSPRAITLRLERGWSPRDAVFTPRTFRTS